MQGKLLTLFYNRGEGLYVLGVFLCSAIGSSAEHFNQCDFTCLKKHLNLKVILGIVQLQSFKVRTKPLFRILC